MTPRFQNLEGLHLPERLPDARKQLARILTALVRNYGARRIVAFGSCVTGDSTEHSDVDLCVVREHPPSSTHPQWEARMAVARVKHLLPLDILVRTPAQFEAARRRPFGVMDEVVNNGVALYEG